MSQSNPVITPKVNKTKYIIGGVALALLCAVIFGFNPLGTKPKVVVPPTPADYATRSSIAGIAQSSPLNTLGNQTNSNVVADGMTLYGADSNEVIKKATEAINQADCVNATTAQKGECSKNETLLVNKVIDEY